MQFWHLCTPGKSQCLLFRELSDYVQGMNMVALSAYKYSSSVWIYAFELMSNHFHFVIQARREDAQEFYEDFYNRLRRFLGRQGRKHELNDISYSLIPIDNETYLKNLIAYVHRNAFLVNSSCTPFSWLWGTNAHIFSSLEPYLNKTYLNSIAKRPKQDMFHSREVDFPDNYYLIHPLQNHPLENHPLKNYPLEDDNTATGYISPACYCKIAECEKLFKSAHQYYFNITRKVESFSDIARELGDSITYTDEEIFSVTTHLLLTKYNKEKLSMLNRNEKIEMAKVLHFNYNAGNEQICRVLRLSDALIDSMFPKACE